MIGNFQVSLQLKTKQNGKKPNARKQSKTVEEIFQDAL